MIPEMKFQAKKIVHIWIYKGIHKPGYDGIVVFYESQRQTCSKVLLNLCIIRCIICKSCAVMLCSFVVCI